MLGTSPSGSVPAWVRTGALQSQQWQKQLQTHRQDLGKADSSPDPLCGLWTSQKHLGGFGARGFAACKEADKAKLRDSQTLDD